MEWREKNLMKDLDYLSTILFFERVRVRFFIFPNKRFHFFKRVVLFDEKEPKTVYLVRILLFNFTTDTNSRRRGI